jgi:hypothetical protein
MFDNDDHIVPKAPKAKAEPASQVLEYAQPPPRIFLRSISPPNSTEITLDLQTLDSGEHFTANALLDSGATGMFIDAEYVRLCKFTTSPLPRAVPVYNIDGTLNEGGSIREEVELVMRFQGHSERATFQVTNLGRHALIVGHTWLRLHNPDIDWATGKVNMSRCPLKCQTPLSPAPTRPKAKHTPVPLDTTESHSREEQEVAKLWPGDRLLIAWLPPAAARVQATETASTRLAAKEAQRHQQSDDFNTLVPPEYHQYHDVFSKESFDDLPHHRHWDHAIELKPGSEPKSSRVYPLSLDEQKELDEFLKENLASGRIRPSKSPMAAPVFFVKKKDGRLRLVQDYRKLNEMTIKNRYPIPLVSDLVNKLRHASYFTKLDIRWGYNNIRIKEGDEWKAAFRTNRGLFEPLVMFFGLTNSPSTFQTMMNDIFRDLIDQGQVVVYLDDILIFTEDIQTHQQITRQVLDVLRQHKLYLCPAKCEFHKRTIEYLGLIIGQGTVEMDPVKVEGVSKWPTPTNLTEVQSFIGFCNFYRRFIRDFSGIARPLHNLTKKDTPFAWGTVQQQAFQELKDTITSHPILAFPNEDKPFRLEADSSDYATGAELAQLGDDGKWHPIAFMSKSLSETERNYDIHDKELLAIIRALEEWRHFLEGAKHQFEIYTDHQNLKYFQTAQKLTRRQARWSLFLSRFDFTMVHRAGKQSGKPDALSRRSDHKRGESDNQNQVLLRPQWFKIAAAQRGHAAISAAEKDVLREIRNCKEQDEAVVKAVEELRTAGTNRLTSAEWSEESGLILFRGKVYVPKNLKLRTKIVQLHHDTPVAGHPGRWKTLELVSRNYWWPNISRFIGQYVNTCHACNRTKTYPQAPAGTLMPNRIPTKRWQCVTTDLITQLPASNGHEAIFVVVDRLTKQAHFAPTQNEVTSLGIARLFRDNVWKHHGLPEEIISDRGTQFVSTFMRELNRLLGIKTSASTAYHPQTDGQTERVNQEIEQYLRLFVNYRQDDWVDWLPLAEFAYNNRVQASTRMTPFMANYGHNPRMGTEPIRDSTVEGVNEFTSRMNQLQEECEAALKQAADDMSRFYDLHRQAMPSYRPGDKVWLDSHNIKTTRPAKKLDDKWFGPFEVLEKINDNAYRIKLPSSFLIHPVFHLSKLRAYKHDELPGRTQEKRPPPAVIQDGVPQWEVEHIEDSRLYRGKLQYLVKWKGYPKSEQTWEPEANMREDAPLAVRRFHRQHPSAPARVSGLSFQRLPLKRLQNFTEPDTTDGRALFDWTKGRNNE